MDWTEKYRPRSLRDVVGNGPAVGRLRAWAEAWQEGVPAVRAIVLAGPPGTGKTTTALALAADMGWPVIELNASDARNAGTIKRVATAGAVHQTFAADGSFHAVGVAGAGSSRKLIVLDEADNLYERLGAEGLDDAGRDLSDKGGKAQIVETLRQTRQPIILIVNDLYALEKGSGAAIKSLAETLKFTRLQARSIAPALERIVKAEGIQADRDTLELVAARSNGDMRAAVRDLESLALGRTRIARDDLGTLGGRDSTTTMHDLVGHILKGKRLEDLRREVQDSDASPEDLVLWVDENMPREYRHPEDLVAGYGMLSRADMFLGRTKSTQDYGLWKYASQLSTLGVSAVRRHEPSRGYTPVAFPQWLSRMSRTKGVRQAKDRLAEGLGRATHAGKRKTRMEQVEPFALLFALDREFAVEQAFRLDLDDEEVALLLGAKGTVGELKAIRKGVEDLQASVAAGQAAARATAAKGLGGYERPAGSGRESDAPARRVPSPEPPAPPTTKHEAGDDAKPEKPRPGVGQKRLF